MNLYEEVLGELEQNKSNKEKGIANGIPFPFERWRDYIPTIDKGMHFGLIASTGIGKSRWIRHSFIYEMVRFSINHSYPTKILYFALEDGKQQVFKKIISHYLFDICGIRVPTKVLDSKEDALPDEYLNIIKSHKEFYNKFLEIVAIINDATTPSEIFNICQKAYAKFGKTHHLIVIIDNLSNVTKDSNQANEYEAVKYLCRNLIRLELCKKMDFTVMSITQMDFESEKNSFRSAGKAITSIEPNLGSFGDIKIISRSMHYVFALFNPWRYEILKYPNSNGYDIDILRNRFRSLNLVISKYLCSFV